MKTKLEIGKEYWLSAQKISRGIYLGESNSGNFDFRITLGSKCTKPLGELDVMTSNLSVYSEYIHEKPWSFTTPIAMKCTEEQFNGIKDKLAEMGYKEVCMSNWDEGDYIVNNLMKHIGSLSNIFDVDANEFGRIMVDTFNPDLFLSLAAMTNKEDGIKGEWWMSGLTGKLIMQSESYFSHPTLRKATEQEIIEYFEKKEFVLPKFWHVVVTEENVDVLSKWRFGEEYPKYKLNIGYIVGFSSWQNSKQHNPSDSRGSFGSEITSDQFKKYVLKEAKQSCQIIHIPPTKQAILFDDRVEITDWKPVLGEKAWQIFMPNYEFSAQQIVFKNTPYQKDLLELGFIKRTESEAKSLVEKLKQAML